MANGSSTSRPQLHDAAQRAAPPAPEKLCRSAACRAPRIVLAEDDPEMRGLLCQSLRRDGYDVIAVADGNALLAELAPAERPVDLVISDIRMPGRTGLDVLGSLRGDAAAPPILLITAFGDPATHALAERWGAVAVFDKPFAVDDLRAFIRGALGASRPYLADTRPGPALAP